MQRQLKTFSKYFQVFHFSHVRYDADVKKSNFSLFNSNFPKIFFTLLRVKTQILKKIFSGINVLNPTMKHFASNLKVIQKMLGFFLNKTQTLPSFGRPFQQRLMS